MSQQESLTEMFKKMSDMIEGLVEENEKLKEHNTLCEKMVKDRQELNEFGKIWDEEIIGKMIHPLYFSSSIPVYTPAGVVSGLMDKVDKLEEKNAELEKKNAELEKKWEEHTDSIVETYFANTGCADITHKELEKLKEKNAELEKKNAELDMVEDLFNKYCSIIDENADAWEDWISESECYKRNEDGEIVEIDEDQ